MRMLFLIVLLFFAPCALAAEPPVIKADMATLKHTSSARVDKVIDGQTILMNDGKIIRLLALEYPLPAYKDPEEPELAAKERLEKLLPKSTEVMYYQTRNLKAGRTNRMGETLAHLVRKDNEEWINGTLIAEGLAWVSTDAANPELSAQLYTLEQKARDEKKGLWAENSKNGLLTAETASEGDGNFRVVEGTINRAASIKNNLYLNFGDDWKKDFTVMISPTLRKTFARNGLNLMNLSGQKVRVRGWVRQWNGPYIELEAPEQLELIPVKQP